jgi:hypothetical protein
MHVVLATWLAQREADVIAYPHRREQALRAQLGDWSLRLTKGSNDAWQSRPPSRSKDHREPSASIGRIAARRRGSSLKTELRRRQFWQARAYAASALLDRGHGRPAQAHTGESGTRPVIVNITEEFYPNG